MIFLTFEQICGLILAGTIVGAAASGFIIARLSHNAKKNR